MTSLMLSAWGLVVAYRLALRFSSRPAALLAALSLGWGTFLYWYLTTEPTMSHNLSFATAALGFLLIQRRPTSASGWLLAGAAIGFSASVRFVNVFVAAAALPVLTALARSDAGRRAEAARGLIALGAGTLIGFAPQMYAWWRIFGRPIVIPHGSDFLDRPPDFLDVLFSPQAGLFAWSPLLYLAVPGLLAFRRLGGPTAAGYWLAILLVWWTNARATGWVGAGYGARRFCTLLPLAAVGLAISYDWITAFARARPWAAPVSVALGLTVWNLLLAEGNRQVAWKWDEPVAFPQMARVAADLVDRSLGPPASLPGSLLESLRRDQGLPDYEAAKLRRVFSVFRMRFGEADGPYLQSGFGVPLGAGESLRRLARDGTIAVSLHRSEEYVLSADLRGRESQRVVVEANGAEIAGCPLSSASTLQCRALIPASAIRAGRNQFRFRVTPPDPSGAEFFSLSLVPARIDAAPPRPADAARP
jgi:hypothetical protein